eukprot:CAMPEP_0194543462 /NCGR_PEP_ID=MMETSP0253-20130528/85851_1 /TAXON_ID=2966 /ORGANISM="Noctiluca scintillans" /LENGTH=59 /DNA_ID=CAMNT_0039390223 /DNA_START=63 /DNA_END=242 /DNA_ORIENTATION=-
MCEHRLLHEHVGMSKNCNEVPLATALSSRVPSNHEEHRHNVCNSGEVPQELRAAAEEPM